MFCIGCLVFGFRFELSFYVGFVIRFGLNLGLGSDYGQIWIFGVGLVLVLVMVLGLCRGLVLGSGFEFMFVV